MTSDASHFRTVVLRSAGGYLAWCACGYNGSIRNWRVHASHDVSAHRAVCPYKKRY